ncbi:MAG: bifunctional response regulator/alkaline phosphatase family protein [Bacteroidetes bacterium]|nr:bifunctional response regulator/alkaline phosphatase family protein [Bacteroidota bacterium]
MAVNILWADDEIELLKPHLIFLKEKGYDVATATNGNEAIDLIKDKLFDVVLLDENMPGLSGLETLNIIKNLKPALPVIMITKSEEESIMEDAIGSKIADYLIKPVNPNQILLSLKKTLDNKRLITAKTVLNYQQEFRQLGMALSNRLDHHEWIELYKKMTYWELELEKSKDDSLNEILKMQKVEANSLFSDYVEDNYTDWLAGKTEDKPVFSHTVFKEKCIPILKKHEKTFIILIDNLRFDQWKILQPRFEELFNIEIEDLYFSILPTTTEYARNAFFAGLVPIDIMKKYPQYWDNGEDESSRNRFEMELLGEQLKRNGLNIKFHYNKILTLSAGKKFAENIDNYLNANLNVLVYNFVDMLSHARTEMEVIKELVDDEAAYRSLTLSWFDHSPLTDIINHLHYKKINVIITTDHGSIKVSNPLKVIGDKNTNANLRFKTGKSLQYEKKEVLDVSNPAMAYLPQDNVSSRFIFAKKDGFFVYPNNYNYYVNYYRNTFQHGGISLEEMIVPFVFLRPKS